MHPTRSAFLIGLAFGLCGCSNVQGPEPGTATLPATGEEPDLQGVSVVFYNVENLFDTQDDPRTNDNDFTPRGEYRWTRERYTTKCRHLAEAISWTGAELPWLIGLAEVEDRAVVEDLARTPPLDRGHYSIVHQDSPDERGIDVALLLREQGDGLELRSAEWLEVALAGDRTRDVLYARLRLRGSDWHVFVNHWPSRGGGQRETEPKRMAAAHVVRERVDRILAADPAARVLIMGDLNDGPTDRSVQKGLRASCTVDVKADLFDLMCMDQPAGHGSHQYDGAWNYLDQFVVSRSVLRHVSSAQAHWDERLLFKHPKFGLSPDKTYGGGRYQGGYSDHLPIVLELR